MGGSLLIWYWILRTDYTVRARLKTVITHSYTFCNWGHFNWIELNWIFCFIGGLRGTTLGTLGIPKAHLEKATAAAYTERETNSERESKSARERERELQPKTNVLFLQRAKCNNKSSGSSLQLSERSSYSPIWASTVSECVCVCVCAGVCVCVCVCVSAEYT